MEKGMKILVVEDDFKNRKLLQSQLSFFGECDSAVDGVEAILAFQMGLDNHQPYDLICLDIRMPNMDGTEALQKIRQIENELGIKDDEKVKVIMTTALDDAESVVESYQEGATAYLVKPITKKKLVEELLRLDLID
jgi:two-component system chemotaxis response regulator CheY